MSAAPPLPAFSRVTRRQPCPICGGDGWCRIFADGGVQCMRVDVGGTPCRSGGWMHWPTGREWHGPLAVVHRLPTPARPALDAAFVDQVYHALLERCPLSPEDRALLRQQRHFSDAQIARHGYGTLPALTPGDRRRLAAEVSARVGRDPGGCVPGFVHTSRGTEVVDQAGIVVPFLDNLAQIVGLQVRATDPAAKPRYTWFSHGDRTGSVGQNGHVVHVARPDRPYSTHHIVITEGPIKANTTADRCAVVTLAVAGVTNTAEILSAIRDLGDVEAVTLAFDADLATNELVAAAEARLALRLAEAGLSVDRWHWSAENGKGIDDLLNAGLLPIARVHPAVTTSGTRQHQPSEHGEQLIQLEAERDAALAITRARARIQRNKRLPAREMAIVLTGVFSQATTSSAPAGAYTGTVPAGYVAASVRELAIDAGCGETNAGNQLKALEHAGIIRRHIRKETLPAGQVDPDSGERLTTPRVYSRHFVAIAGHEEEHPTLKAVHGLIERLATFTTDEPERRGGRRIPRCEWHPHAAVIKHWEARCAECDAILDTGEAPVPAMHLEPLASRDQPLSVQDARDPKGEADPAVARDQTLGLRPELTDTRGVPSRVSNSKSPLGVRPYGPKRWECGERSPQESLVVERRRRAAEDLTARTEAATGDPLRPELNPESWSSSLVVIEMIEMAECHGCGAAIPANMRVCTACDAGEAVTDYEQDAPASMREHSIKQPRR